MDFIESESVRQQHIGRTAVARLNQRHECAHTLHRTTRTSACTMETVVDIGYGWKDAGKMKEAADEHYHDEGKVCKPTPSAGTLRTEDTASDESDEQKAADTGGPAKKGRKRRFTDREIAVLSKKLQRGELRSRQDREMMAQRLSNNHAQVVTERQLKHWMSNHKKAMKKRERESERTSLDTLMSSPLP